MTSNLAAENKPCCDEVSDMDIQQSVASTSIHVKGMDETGKIIEECELVSKGLRKAHNLCIEQILRDSSGRFDYVASKYAAILKGKTKQELITGITEVMKNVKDATEEQFTTLLEQEQITYLVAELEEIIAKSPVYDEARTVWRPSGDPEEDIKPHIYQQKLDLNKTLEEKLKQEEEEFATLKAEIIQKREKLKNTFGEIEQLSKRFDKEAEQAKNFLDLHKEKIFHTLTDISSANM